MSDARIDLSRHVLRPTPEELRDTHVLFHTRHATDLTEERRQLYGHTVVYHSYLLTYLRTIGLKVTAGSDTEMLFGDLDFDFIYFTQIESTFDGHEMLIPGIAAYRGIPFLGPSAPVRALSEDKVLGKALAAAVGVKVAAHHVLDPRRPATLDFSPPGRWIVKPRTGVMSEHLVLVEDQAGWRRAREMVTDPSHAGRPFIAEEFVPGLNLTVPVIEGLPPESLSVFIEQGEPRDNVLTETGKEGQSSDYEARPYSGPGAAQASAAAARMAAAISPFDYARFDFRYDPEADRLVFLEVNMNCAMGPVAVVTLAAKMRGIEYQDLVSHIFTHSLRRQRGTR